MEVARVVCITLWGIGCSGWYILYTSGLWISKLKARGGENMASCLYKFWFLKVFYSVYLHSSVN